MTLAVDVAVNRYVSAGFPALKQPFQVGSVLLLPHLLTVFCYKDLIVKL